MGSLRLRLVIFQLAVRNRLARNITAINKAAIPSSPGIPTSSTKPVEGKAVLVGITVRVTAAACVSNADTVAVRGSPRAAEVFVGTATTGVGELVGVFVGGMGVTVAVGLISLAA